MRAAVVCIAAGLATSAASADVFQWNWQKGDPGLGSTYFTNDVAGEFESVGATYNSDTREMTWSVTFGDRKTGGITLAVNDGPNPKGHHRELALIYADMTGGGAQAKVTAYAYNGKNLRDSYKDGDGQTAGDQTPDLIKSANQQGGWVTNASIFDFMQGSEPWRTLSLSFDATDLFDHHDGDVGYDDWTAIGFGDKLGLWMHTYKGLSTGYNAGGALTNWGSSAEGWFDGNDQQTVVVPLPAPALLGLAGLAGVAALRKRIAR
jgi:hypothetical protein